MKYDYIIVGAGLSGGIIARELATKYNKRILIVEKRNHVAGNLFEYENDRGLVVQKYGPHVFHTNSDKAYNYITSFCDPLFYRTKCEAVIDCVSTPSPFNFKTIDQFYAPFHATKLKRKLKEQYGDRESVSIVDLLRSDVDIIRSFAHFLYEKDYKLYTAKQWNLDPSEIDPSVLKRVPVVLSYSDTYFSDKYEFVPRDGFNALYERIISHPNISLRLNEDALDHISLDFENGRIMWDGVDIRVVYTGPVDELFAYRYGLLPYRSLRFDINSEETQQHQNAFIVAYPQEKGFTRITEYSKLPYANNKLNNKKFSVYSVEWPIPYDKSNGSEPYYPVLTAKSMEMNKKYQELALGFYGLTICGRLADFKYYNMDQATTRALEAFAEMEKKYGTKI